MITNLNEVRAAHRRLVKHTDYVVKAELERAEGFAQKHVRENPRGFKHRTGRLIQATRATVTNSRDRKVILSNARKYALTLEYGSRPHLILPRRKKFLRFRGRDGNWVFARKVMHPGFPRGSRFLYRAAYAYYRVLGPNLEQRLSRVASRF